MFDSELDSTPPTVNLLPLPSLQATDILSFNLGSARPLVYVDKTYYLTNLAKAGGSFLFTRPQHFGKSLTASSLAALLRYGPTAFPHTWLSNNAQAWPVPPQPVLYLDLSEVYLTTKHNLLRPQQELAELCSQTLKQAVLKSQISISLPESDDWEYVLEQVLAQLSEMHASIIIDSYDAPLTHSLGPQAERLFPVAYGFMQHFFATFKKYASGFFFVFFTGLSHHYASFFAGLPYFHDLTLAPLGATLAGFTEAEMRTYFAPHLEHAAKVLTEKHLTLYSVDQLLEELRQNYQGYNFVPHLGNPSTAPAQVSPTSGTSGQFDTKVYNPASVLPFLNNPHKGYSHYWINSGGSLPHLLQDLIFKVPKQEFIDFVQQAQAKHTFTISMSDLNQSHSAIDTMLANLPALFYQVGYLSIQESDGKNLVLGIPNSEVEQALANILWLRKFQP